VLGHDIPSFSHNADADGNLISPDCAGFRLDSTLA
jgi:hypothetical protein